MARVGVYNEIGEPLNIEDVYDDVPDLDDFYEWRDEDYMDDEEWEDRQAIAEEANEKFRG